MKNGKKEVTYNGKVWLITAGVVIFVLWKLVELICYGHSTSKISDDIMFIVWIFTLNFAFRMGKGEDVFSFVREWWAAQPGMNAEEFAAAQAAKKATEAPVVIDADYECINNTTPPDSAAPAAEKEEAEVPVDQPVLKVNRSKAKKAKTADQKTTVMRGKKVKAIRVQKVEEVPVDTPVVMSATKQTPKQGSNIEGIITDDDLMDCM